MKGGLNDCLLHEGVVPTFSPISAKFVLKLDSMSAIMGFSSSGFVKCPTNDFFRAHDILALMIVNDE